MTGISTSRKDGPISDSVPTRMQGTNAGVPLGRATRDIRQTSIEEERRLASNVSDAATLEDGGGCGKLGPVSFLFGAGPVWLVVAASLAWLRRRHPAPMGLATVMTVARG